MLRDKNLVPLSRQHQHALALCVRIERASPIEESKLLQWQTEMAQQFEAEIKIHFSAEEQTLFPAARRFVELSSLVDELLGEHASLRACFTKAEAGQMRSDEITDFARKLSEHVRKEERQLFERLQQLLPAEEMDRMGGELDRALENASQTCSLPTPKQ
ncbi:MAG TPA: hemerythrin domain-containing protein [Candidatus Eisenbacteria bacterium]|nr:hemerythrin domain-containing protein [Candidatus Eisenbacteria bacterium]